MAADLLSLDRFYLENKESCLDGWQQFLRFASISTTGEHQQDCLDCHDWLLGELEKLGFKTRSIVTGGNPVVYGELLYPGAAKTVLFYGHYDVQPVDPVEAWNSEPFNPQIRTGRMYARGAQDNKGQIWYSLKAIEALLESGQLKCNLKILIEGEEETGSGGLMKTLPQLPELVKADVLLICDSGTISPDLGSITVGLRGVLTFSVRVFGLRGDLHSGVHGGLVANPANQLARLLAALHNEDGSVAIPSFNDGITELAEEERLLASQIPFDSVSYKEQIGVEALGGEVAFSPQERRGLRPTLDVNGIFSGYSGLGSKTIIPREATAKLSARLVGGQDPDFVYDAIERFVFGFDLRGLKVEVFDRGFSGVAVHVKPNLPMVRLAAQVLEEIHKKPSVFIWEGASIPIVAQLQQVSMAQPVLVGFGLEEDCIHAPNESFSLDQFYKGFLFVGRFLSMIED